MKTSYENGWVPKVRAFVDAQQNHITTGTYRKNVYFERQQEKQQRRQ
jgi:hypothetical protein